MINFKLENNLVGDKFWKAIPSVFLKGIQTNRKLSKNLSIQKREEIIQSWNNIAVLKATSENPTKFYFGFTNFGIIQFLEYEFVTDLEFGVRIGNNDIRFFVIPKDISSDIKLDLIEKTKESDEKYKDLIII